MNIFLIQIGAEFLNFLIFKNFYEFLIMEFYIIIINLALKCPQKTIYLFLNITRNYNFINKISEFEMISF